jgi:hypothetical protein
MNVPFFSDIETEFIKRALVGDCRLGRYELRTTRRALRRQFLVIGDQMELGALSREVMSQKLNLYPLDRC